MGNDWVVAIAVCVVGAMILLWLINLARHGSFKAAAFNAQIDRYLGEVEFDQGVFLSQRLSVYALSRRGEPCVGVEFPGWTDSGTGPIVLDPAQARQLAAMLNEACVSNEALQ